eukprot:5445161-Pyramimonas_sp.AAC.1
MGAETEVDIMEPPPGDDVTKKRRISHKIVANAASLGFTMTQGFHLSAGKLSAEGRRIYAATLVQALFRGWSVRRKTAVLR